MDPNVISIVNPNFSLPGDKEQEEQKAAAEAAVSKDASAVTPNQPEAPRQHVELEEGEFELYQTGGSSGREFNLSKLLGRMRSGSSSSSSSTVHVKADVSDALLKKPSAVYSATASIVGKLAAWMDRKASSTSASGRAKEGSPGSDRRDADTQTGKDHEHGPPFEDVPL
ncbi:hypothetical protein V5799_019747 [Amblyomma americanum]|uniref:Uncharacterized protein n=1 Tax=Amblyomma americanum TaxID=6943 RepID=A0AAQ4EWB2_AMBAM